MLVDDVGAQRDVIGGGDVQLVGVPEHAVLPVGEFLRVLVDVLAQALAVAQALGRALLNGLVHPAAGLLPHAEGAVLDGGGHVFAGAAQVRQLEVVDGAGAVARDVGDVARLHQRDQIAGQAALDHVRAHGEDDLMTALLRRLHAAHQLVKLRAAPVRDGGLAGGCEGVDAHQIVAVMGGIGGDAGKIQLHASAIHRASLQVILEDVLLNLL